MKKLLTLVLLMGAMESKAYTTEMWIMLAEAIHIGYEETKSDVAQEKYAAQVQESVELEPIEVNKEQKKRFKRKLLKQNEATSKKKGNIIKKSPWRHRRT